jgi:hypothetical protein
VDPSIVAAEEARQNQQNQPYKLAKFTFASKNVPRKWRQKKQTVACFFSPAGNRLYSGRLAHFGGDERLDLW